MMPWLSWWSDGWQLEVRMFGLGGVRAWQFFDGVRWAPAC